MEVMAFPAAMIAQEIATLFPELATPLICQVLTRTLVALGLKIQPQSEVPLITLALLAMEILGV